MLKVNKNVLTIHLDHSELANFSDGSAYSLLDETFRKREIKSILLDLHSLVYLSREEVISLKKLAQTINLLGVQFEYIGMSDRLSLAITSQGGDIIRNEFIQ